MDAKLAQLKALFEKYLDKVETTVERFELHDLMQEYTQEELVDLLLTLLPNEKYLDDSFDQTNWQASVSAIMEEAKKEPPVVPISREPLYRLLLVKWAAAAIILFAILTPFIIRHFKKPQLLSAQRQKIPLDKGGRSEATGGLPATPTPCGLVVPSQEQMDADSSIIHIDIDNDMETMSVAPGWQFPLELSDGSKVVLNSASSITYPQTFTENKREVKITGEVYFDIAPVRLGSGGRKPFYVKVKDAELQVLGTSFNVNAYADNGSFNTTLVSGSLRAIKGKKSALLKPGQQATITSQAADGASIQVGTGDTAQANLWRSGYFSFRQTTVEDALSELSHWYNWQIEYKTPATHIPFTASFCRKTSEAEVLDLLRSKGIKFTKTGNKITITQ